MKALNEITEVVNLKTLPDESATEVFTENEFKPAISISGTAHSPRIFYPLQKLTITLKVSSNMDIKDLTFPPNGVDTLGNLKIKCNIGNPTSTTKRTYSFHHIFVQHSYFNDVNLILTATNARGVKTKRKTKVIVQTGTDPIIDVFPQSNKGKLEEK